MSKPFYKVGTDGYTGNILVLGDTYDRKGNVYGEFYHALTIGDSGAAFDLITMLMMELNAKQLEELQDFVTHVVELSEGDE